MYIRVCLTGVHVCQDAYVYHGVYVHTSGCVCVSGCVTTRSPSPYFIRVCMYIRVCVSIHEGVYGVDVYQGMCRNVVTTQQSSSPRIMVHDGVCFLSR